MAIWPCELQWAQMSAISQYVISISAELDVMKDGAFVGQLKCAMLAAARDTRREGMLVGGTNKKHMVTYQVDPREDALQVAAL